MPEIHVTLLGRFAVTVGGVPVAREGEGRWRHHDRSRLAAQGFLKKHYGAYARVNRGAYDRVVRIYHE